MAGVHKQLEYMVGLILLYLIVGLSSRIFIYYWMDLVIGLNRFAVC